MNYRYCLLLVTSFIVIGLMPAGVFAQGAPRPITRQGTNWVEGKIITANNSPVYNAYVELYNDVGSLIDRQRSSTQGRFSFKGMGPGRYTVHVKPYGSNLLEEVREIEVNNQTTGSDFVSVNFRLSVDKRTTEGVTIVGTVFAQEVPQDARRLYASGIEGLEANPDKALADLEAAVKSFPAYFDALAAVGKAYILKGNYGKGYPYLLKAIDINLKCADCYYSLALAFYKLNQIPAAIKAVDASALLQPGAPVIRLLQGIIYRINGDLTGAEKALLLARKLFKEPNHEVNWQLSLVYNRMKRNQDAAKELEEYLKVKPNVDKAEKQHVLGLIDKMRKAK